MKRLFSFVIGLLLLMPAIADTFLNVHQIDGSIIKYAFADKPILTYVEKNVLITTEKVQVEYPVNELAKVTIEELKTSIGDVNMGSKIAEQNVVYDMRGMVVATFSNNDYFDFNSLPDGVFVVKNDITTYKVLKK